MKKTILLHEITQPIGTFYIGKITANELLKISKTNIRDLDNNGIQREVSERRIVEIANYCEDPDATFPTPIIVNMDSDNLIYFDLISKYSEQIENMRFDKEVKKLFNENLILEYDDKIVCAEILDGQHRLKGISKSNIKNIELPLVIMFDLTEEEKAYVFSTINSNQTKVDKSLIYDLFELSMNRSPFKTCHEIARVMNKAENSAFRNKLKMLGKKGNIGESLSQGTFVTYLVSLISKNPKQDMIDIKSNKKIDEDYELPFREYFIGNRDDIIIKILLEFFAAVKFVFKDEWDGTRYILSKTTGYGALLKFFKKIYFEGLDKNMLDKKYFIDKLMLGKINLDQKGLELTSKHFPSNQQTQDRLASILYGDKIE